jgi:hypothetical protein
MTHEDLPTRFRNELRGCLRGKKYADRFNSEDEERAVHIFQLVLDNPSLSEDILFELLTGEIM